MVNTGFNHCPDYKNLIDANILNMQYSLKSQSVIVKSFASYKAYYMGCIGSFHCGRVFYWTRWSHRTWDWKHFSVDYNCLFIKYPLNVIKRLASLYMKTNYVIYIFYLLGFLFTPGDE